MISGSMMSLINNLPSRGAIGTFAPHHWVSLLTLLVALSGTSSALSAQDFRVYMKIADPAQGTVAEVSSRVEAAIEASGWNLLSSHFAGVEPDACSFGAQVMVVDWPEYTQAVLSQGSHGAFAAPLRVSVFEDELGVHVAAINPQNLNRTIVTEEGMEDEWARLAQEFRVTLATAMGETLVDGEFGQKRGKGRIGRTMGIMAGGPFREKLKNVETVPAGEGGVTGVAQSLFETLQGMEAGEDWGIRPVYLMPVSETVLVMGFTGERMEAKSFSIVGRGGNKDRSDFACPGLDHSAAYPLSVLFEQVKGPTGDEVEITLVDEMYRMKMFFEDAGKMKFARNMGMPGSIEDEIKDLIRSALF
jgi:uncharacterized protein (DUF302 family)